MAFRLVLDDSRPLLDHDVPSSPGPLSRQIAALRADYGRASRLLLGTAAALVLGIAIFVVCGLVGAIGLASPFAVIAALLFIAIGAGASWLLISLHRSGRRLSIALADRLTAAHEGGDSLGDVILARTFVFEPFVFWRIAAASIALLFGIMLGSMAFAPTEGDAAVRIAVGAIGVLLIVVGCGVFGGVFRVNRAHARRDPVQRRILGG
ncbi:hypothetical protein ACFVTX_01240 [Agromyces sp. NPDC058136]|uniref:hypothetical protein n=1 Tax=Agromyces sp. NPDC058136 TaxID=3346354 RepID=UPI0036DD1A83